MSLSKEAEKNLASQEKLLRVYVTKALDTTNDPMSIMQNMMFAMFHQTQILLILVAEIDDKLDILENLGGLPDISESINKIMENTRDDKPR